MVDLFALEPKLESQGSCLVALQATQWINGMLQNGVGVVFGHLLNFHTTFGRSDKHLATSSPVVGDRQVILLGDVNRLGHQEFFNLKPFRSGLGRNHPIAQHEVGGLLSLVCGFHQLDEARFAAASRVHLGLDDDQWPSGGEHRLGG